VALYTRHQLVVLLGLLSAFGGGLVVDRWRREHPEAAARLERFDRRDAPPDAVAAVDGPLSRGTPPAPLDRPAAPPPPTPVPGAVGAGHRAPIDVNRATAEELTRLPGIGPALALRIVEARDDRPFASVDDLRRVRGLGAGKLERLRPLVTANPQ
jgi:competence ComEA-like helix-hairpin-helix protein